MAPVTCLAKTHSTKSYRPKDGLNGQVLVTVSSRRASMVVGPVRTALGEEYCMPGQEHPAAHARVADYAAIARPLCAVPPPPPRGGLASRTNRPAVAAVIATLAAAAFTVVRWQTWAHGHISRFILVGRHFATPSQLPHGVPLAKMYGYDGQFFYRLALNPLNFHHTAYGITMDRPYRYMRIGYPALTWLVSAGQHTLVPVMLVAVNIAAIGALGYLGAMFAAQGGRHALAGLLIRGISGSSPACPGTPPNRSPPSACWPACPPPGAARRYWPPCCWPTGR